MMRAIFCTSRGCVRGEDVASREGSFWYYRYRAPLHVKHLAEAIYCAPLEDQKKLRRAFPQMVAAYEMADKTSPPPGFEPRYDAPAPEG